MPGLWDCLRSWLGYEPAKEQPAMPTTAEEHESRQLRHTVRNLSNRIVLAANAANKELDTLDAELAFYRQHLSRKPPHDVDNHRGDGPGGAGDAPGAG